MIDGIIRDLITRPSLALYLARRFEMLDVHEQHHFYTRPGRMPVVHSPISDKPIQVMEVKVRVRFVELYNMWVGVLLGLALLVRYCFVFV